MIVRQAHLSLYLAMLDYEEVRLTNFMGCCNINLVFLGPRLPAVTQFISHYLKKSYYNLFLLELSLNDIFLFFMNIKMFVYQKLFHPFYISIDLLQIVTILQFVGPLLFRSSEGN